jgi:uncharacterized protein YxeA
MSNELVVILAILVSVLGGGAATLILALLRKNEYLKEQVVISQENHRRDVQQWQRKAFQQNQAFLLAARHLTIDQVEEIQDTIQYL